uniref:Mitochondrial basic amino acids transporter n=1 Tax=Globodera rostochiensis TaxID=31243 RepID=A0A914H0R9_GLORO
MPSDILVDFFAGCLGGVAGVLAGHPLDTVKVRLQTQNSHSPIYRNTFHCLTCIVRNEGPSALYRGMSSPLASLTMINAVIFSVHGHISKQFEDPNALHVQFVAGAVAGATQGFISSPMELLKLRAQICHEPTSLAAPKRCSSSPLSMARQIWREKGLRHFSRGLLITQLRDCPAMGVYFASYAFLRRKTDAGSGEQQRLSNLQLLFAGGAAGMCSWLCNYPADVVKTRFQADDAYSNYREVIRKAYAENGWRTFFAGLGPTLIRAIPTNAAIFFTVEWTYRILLKARTIDQKDKALTRHPPPAICSQWRRDALCRSR